MLSDVYQAIRETSATRRAQAELRRLHAENELSITREIGQLFNDDFRNPRQLFDPWQYWATDGMDEQSYLELLRNLHQLYHLNALVSGYTDLFAKFTVGAEFKVHSVDEDPATQEVWDAFNESQAYTIKRCDQFAKWRFLYGEANTRFFSNPRTGEQLVRWMRSYHIRSWPNQWEDTFGIKTNPDDVEEVLGYWYRPHPQEDASFVEGSEVIRDKRGDDDTKRGRPELLSCMDDIIQLGELLRDRRRLHRIRAMCVKQETITGGPLALSALAQRRAAGNQAGTPADSGDTREKAPKAGTWRNTAGVKTEFVTANLGAIDADVDIRRHLLTICQKLGISEPAGTADASNNNRASSEVGESPMVRTFKGEQNTISLPIRATHKRVIQAAMDAGMLDRMSTKTRRELKNGAVTEIVEKVPRNTDARCEFPPIIERNILEEQKAIAGDYIAGFISLETARTKRGYDDGKEKVQIAAEMAEQAEAPPTPEEELAAAAAAGNKAAGRDVAKERRRNGNGHEAKRLSMT